MLVFSIDKKLQNESNQFSSGDLFSFPKLPIPRKLPKFFIEQTVSLHFQCNNNWTDFLMSSVTKKVLSPPLASRQRAGLHLGENRYKYDVSANIFHISTFRKFFERCFYSKKDDLNFPKLLPIFTWIEEFAARFFSDAKKKIL